MNAMALAALQVWRRSLPAVLNEFVMEPVGASSRWRWYGYANWYLNTDGKQVPTAPKSAVRFVGNGNNIIYIDWQNDLVIVTRWSNGLNDLVGKTIASLAPRQTTAGQ